MTVLNHSDIRSVIHFATAFRNPHHRFSVTRGVIFRRSRPFSSSRLTARFSFRSLSSKTEENTGATITGEKVTTKPPICTADELHYVSVNRSQWRLALWRYIPPPQAPKRNHPLLLLSGVGTNAVGYDLSQESSFARCMCGEGFDTWILEVRGAGLSMQESDVKDIEKSAHSISEEMEAAAENTANRALTTEQTSDISQNSSTVSVVEETFKNDESGIATAWDESSLVSKLTDTFMRLSERLSGFLSESQLKTMYTRLLDQISKPLDDSKLYDSFNETKGKLFALLESRQNSAVVDQIRDLSERLVNILEEGQRSVSLPLSDLQMRLMSNIEDFQKQLELIRKYDWDFDHYLEEDVPAAIDYIKAQTGTKDGKLLAIGHSMGGILLYAMLSKYSYEGKESEFTAIVTLASSLDYTSSNSSLKLLVPLADPAEVFNVPVVPLGALLTAAYPLSSRPPFGLSWFNELITAEDMMEPELLKKLVLNNFCTIPTKLLLQLTTAFKEGGLRDRRGDFFYKNHLHKINVPVLAIAGDRDLICPPEAVYETAKLLPKHLVKYEVFGQQDGPHYAHYDVVGGKKAVEEVYPCIIEFLSKYD